MLTVEQKARVEKGARLLDVELPGWFNRVDLEALDISSFKVCVLGQLYGSYFDGVRALIGKGTIEFLDEWAGERGFYPHSEDAFLYRDGAYRMSADKTDYWREVIQKRRAESI